MKIGYIVSSLSKGDGWARYGQGISKTASQMPGTKVVVLTSRNDEVSETDNIHKVLPSKLTFSPLNQLAVFLNCLRFFRGCDIIHTCFEPPMIGAALASRFLGASLVMTLHGTYAIPPNGKSFKDFIKRQLMAFAYGTAKVTTTGSFNTENRVRAVVSSMKECRFIPNGYDSNVFYRHKNIRKEELLLSVGWLKPRKGMDIVINSLGLLKNEFPSLGYKIIGGDTDTEEMEYCKFLRELIAKNNLGGGVEIRLGKISRPDLAKAYNECGVFILVSRDSGDNFEGFPLVYMEAQACGAPIVTTRGYGSNYAVKDGYNGYLVDQEDVPGTAEAIRKIIKDPVIHEQMEKNSIQRAKDHSWPRLMPAVFKLYEDALKI